MRVLKGLVIFIIVFALFTFAFNLFFAQIGLAPAFSFSFAWLNFLLFLFLSLGWIFLILSPLIFLSFDFFYLAISGLIMTILTGFIAFSNNPSNPIEEWITWRVSNTFANLVEKTYFPKYWIIDGKESFVVGDKNGVVYYYTLSDLTSAVIDSFKSLPKKQLKQYCDYLKNDNDGVKKKFFKAVFTLPPKIDFYPLKDKWKNIILLASEDKVNEQVKVKEIEKYLESIKAVCEKTF
jgi:uncharacterized membrane-anchored protein YitT (DUF2179 family)